MYWENLEIDTSDSWQVSECSSTTDIFDLLKFYWKMRKTGLKDSGNWLAWWDFIFWLKKMTPDQIDRSSID